MEELSKRISIIGLGYVIGCLKLWTERVELIWYLSKLGQGRLYSLDPLDELTSITSIVLCVGLVGVYPLVILELYWGLSKGLTRMEHRWYLGINVLLLGVVLLLSWCIESVVKRLTTWLGLYMEGVESLVMVNYWIRTLKQLVIGSMLLGVLMLVNSYLIVRKKGSQRRIYYMLGICIGLVVTPPSVESLVEVLFVLCTNYEVMGLISILWGYKKELSKRYTVNRLVSNVKHRKVKE